jgi:hypothetical protein
MIAKKSVWIEYKKGDASSWELKEGEYANIFFFVINQITDLMAWAAEIAGSDFLFYWVDGIFLRPGIKKAKLNEITRIFAEQGYYYKYENDAHERVGQSGYKNYMDAFLDDFIYWTTFD